MSDVDDIRSSIEAKIDAYLQDPSVSATEKAELQEEVAELLDQATALPDDGTRLVMMQLAEQMTDMAIANG